MKIIKMGRFYLFWSSWNREIERRVKGWIFSPRKSCRIKQRLPFHLLDSWLWKGTFFACSKLCVGWEKKIKPWALCFSRSWLGWWEVEVKRERLRARAFGKLSVFRELGKREKELLVSSWEDEGIPSSLRVSRCLSFVWEERGSLG
jgi:hypothetical protein